METFAHYTLVCEYGVLPCWSNHMLRKRLVVISRGRNEVIRTEMCVKTLVCLKVTLGKLSLDKVSALELYRVVVKQNSTVYGGHN